MGFFIRGFIWDIPILISMISCKTLEPSNIIVYYHKNLGFGSRDLENLKPFAILVITVEARKLEHQYPHGLKGKV